MDVALWIGLLGSVLALPEAPAPVAWSPDGRWLAYTQDVRPVAMPVEPGWLFETGKEAETRPARAVEAPRPATAYRLWTTRPETGESVLLEEARGPLTAPCWNPDGTSLAFGRVVRGTDNSTRWEVVVQEAPDRQRVLVREPIVGAEPTAETVRGLVVAWSPDGRTIAAPRLKPAGLVLIRVEGGKLIRILEGGRRPAWSPVEGKLAYLRGGPDGELVVLDGIAADPRRVALAGAESDRLPGPTWSRDGRSLMMFRRTVMLPQPGTTVKRVGEGFQLIRYRAVGGQMEAAFNLSHDPIGPPGTLLGAWLTVEPDGEDLYFATAMPGQEESQITWSRGKPDETHKRLNPYHASALLGALAARPSSGSLALRIGGGGRWTPPAVCDPESESLTLLAPDDDSRAEWRAKILETILSLLRDSSPSPTLDDGTPVERASLLPAPGEFDPNDATANRLRKLARMGLALGGPTTARDDEIRLAFAYLAEDPQAANEALDSLLARAESTERRFRLLSIRAQIYLQCLDLGRARPLIAYLRESRPGPSHELEETLGRPRMSPRPDPLASWPEFLARKARMPGSASNPAEPEFAPGNVLERQGLKPGGDPAPPPPPPGAVVF